MSVESRIKILEAKMSALTALVDAWIAVQQVHVNTTRGLSSQTRMMAEILQTKSEVLLGIFARIKKLEGGSVDN